MHAQKKYAGVFMDNNHAIVIAASGDDATEYTIQNKVKAHENQNSGNEHTMNNSKQSETLKFFKLASGHLLDYDELLIFGPGKAQEQFQNFLKEDNHFNSKKITTESADNLTDPQMIALVRDFYKP